MKTGRVAFPILLVLTFGLSYSYALTPEQVLKLKKAGVSDKTIQLMLKQESEAQTRNPADQIGSREVTDKNGKTVVIYSTGGASVDQEEKEKVDKAWRMLDNMVIDGREDPRRGLDRSDDPDRRRHDRPRH